MRAFVVAVVFGSRNPVAQVCVPSKEQENFNCFCNYLGVVYCPKGKGGGYFLEGVGFPVKSDVRQIVMAFKPP